MNVLLIYPNFPRVATQPPLGLMYIASVLRQHGHTVKIIEGPFDSIRLQFEQLRIREFPGVIGISCMTSMYDEILKMRDYFHQWDIPLIFGGPHASILPYSLLTHDDHFIDYVVMGEGEYTILQIIDSLCHATLPLEDQIIQSDPIDDLDELPFPARDLVHPKYFRHHHATILASRGCPFNCSFCQPTLRKVFGAKVRRRSVDNVIAEMDDCYHHLGIDTFEFFDDTFTSDKKWVYQFCDAVKEYPFKWEILTRVDMVDEALLQTMKEANLVWVRLGIESGSQAVLNGYRKGTTVEQNRAVVKACNRLGIKVHGFFMVGALNETQSTVDATKAFIKELEFDTIFVHITMPMPCTALYSQAEKEGRLKGDWPSFDYLGNMTTTGGRSNPDTSVPMRLDGLSDMELVASRYDLLKTFYWRKVRNPLYLLKFLWNKGFAYTWSAARNILRG